MSADAGESGDEPTGSDGAGAGDDGAGAGDDRAGACDDGVGAGSEGDQKEPYVHRPEGEPASSAAPAAGDGSGLGFRGQVLVAAVVLATLVIPGLIYLYPALLADRVPFLVAMLVLPLVPAFLLGAAAVWAMAGRQ